MTMNGIGHYDLYSRLSNTEAFNRIPKSTAEVTSTTLVNDELGKVKDLSVDGAVVSDKAESVKDDKKQTTGFEESTLGLKAIGEFDFVGKNSDIRGLNMEKAVSDMQKDQMLEQYQYFIGDSSTVENTEDGIVIQKSGFGMY